MSGFEKTITAAIIGACIVLINTLLDNIKLKKILNQCTADYSSTDTFEYKGSAYSKSKYLELSAPKYKKTSKSDLQRMIKNYKKSLKKGKLSEMQILDLSAMESALNNK